MLGCHLVTCSTCCFECLTSQLQQDDKQSADPYLEDDLPTLVVPGVQLAAAPARDELLHAVTVQVEGEDRRGLVLGLDPPPPRRLLVHAHRAVSQGVPESALL